MTTLRHWLRRIEEDDIPGWLRTTGLVLGGIIGFVIIDVVAWYLMAVPAP